MILQRRIRTFYEQFISLQGEPARIAAGLAVGVFVGVTPTIPFHTAIIVLIGLIFRQHIAAGYLGAWIVSNPVTIPLLYLSQYEIGRFLLGMERYRLVLNDYSFGSIVALGWKILLPLLTGGFVMAPFFAVPAFFVARRVVKTIRRKNNP